MKPIAYLNGEFVSAEQCRLPVYDLGIVLSAAVTDFIRTFNGEPYRMEDHVLRLYRSCKYACIEPPISIKETMDVSRRLIEHNLQASPGSELGLIYYITAGENAIYAGSAGLTDELKPTVVQHTFPLPFHIWKHVFIDGLHCVTPYVRHVPPEMFSSKIKHRNRMHMWIGEQQARLADPKAIALFLDPAGNVTETGGSNFVIYRDGAIISPKRNNILWGVSLQALSEIADGLGIGFVEDDIQVYDVVNADEAWVPTTPYCLGPVTRINGIAIGDGTPGPVWRKIIARWSEIVGKDIYAEITG